MQSPEPIVKADDTVGELLNVHGPRAAEHLMLAYERARDKEVFVAALIARLCVLRARVPA